MQVSEIVVGWCRERNRMTRAYQWLCGLLAAWAAGFVWIIFGPSPPSLSALLLVGVATVAWNAFAPKPEQVSTLRGQQRNRYVPDSLLEQLADAATVPDWVKGSIAETLEQDGFITFEALFELDGWIARGEDRARRERRPGFQKMAAFKDKPNTTEEEAQ